MKFPFSKIHVFESLQTKDKHTCRKYKLAKGFLPFWLVTPKNYNQILKKKLLSEWVKSHVIYFSNILEATRIISTVLE